MLLAVDRFPAGSVDGTRRLVAGSVVCSAPDGRRGFRMLFVDQSEMVAHLVDVVNSVGRFALLGAPGTAFFSRGAGGSRPGRSGGGGGCCCEGAEERNHETAVRHSGWTPD